MKKRLHILLILILVTCLLVSNAAFSFAATGQEVFVESGEVLYANGGDEGTGEVEDVDNSNPQESTEETSPVAYADKAELIDDIAPVDAKEPAGATEPVGPTEKAEEVVNEGAEESKGEVHAKAAETVEAAEETTEEPYPLT